MPLPITLSFKLSFERREEKPILVEGVLDRVRNRLAPVGLAGAGS
jgi:hypothetical protein